MQKVIESKYLGQVMSADGTTVTDVRIRLKYFKRHSLKGSGSVRITSALNCEFGHRSQPSRHRRVYRGACPFLSILLRAREALQATIVGPC